MMTHKTFCKIMSCIYGEKDKVALISKKTDLTYSQTLRNIKLIENKGLLKTSLADRSRYVGITDKGEEVLIYLNKLNELCGDLIQ